MPFCGRVGRLGLVVSTKPSANYSRTAVRAFLSLRGECASAKADGTVKKVGYIDLMDIDDPKGVAFSSSNAIGKSDDNEMIILRVGELRRAK